MPPKRRKRLTAWKKKAPKDAASFLEIFSSGREDDEYPHDPKPSEAEWKHMCRAGQFSTEGVTFRQDDCAEVRWKGEDETPWFAHIVSIRARAGSKYPWVYVRWYYTKTDLINEFGPGHGLELLSARELVYSDRPDLLSYRVFKKIVHVVDWHDDNTDYRITPETLFTRSRLLWIQSFLKNKPIFDLRKGTDFCDLAPGGSTCHLWCKHPYDPFLPPQIFTTSRLALLRGAQEIDDECRGVALQADSMHFCSRPNCRRWFHRSCLTYGGGRHIESEDAYVEGSRPMRRIAYDPLKRTQLVHPLFMKYLGPKTPSGEVSSEDLNSYTLVEILQRETGKDSLRLPDSVVRIAAMPIIRRADYEGSYRVNGNMDDVLLARQLLHQELEFGREDLEAQLGEFFQYYDSVPWHKDSRVVEYITTLLSTNRIVASPLTRYWDHVEKVYEQMYGDDDVPDLCCPQCNAPI